MKKQIKLHHAPWLQNSNITRLFDAYAHSGFEIRVVGGCVRDALCAQTIKDWDLATPALPDQNIVICHNMGAHVIETGLKHGTITAVINSEAFEITTLRRDQSTDGRHATVTWSNDWEVDALRRDFTINALYGDAQGNVIDYTGGFDDLENKTIRFIGDPEQRIKEDYLRIMRFFRFMAGYGDFKHIDLPSLEACNILHPFLAQISSERIQNELWKILIAQNRADTVELMTEIGIFKTLNLPLRNVHLGELNTRVQDYNLHYSPLRALAFLLDPDHDWSYLKKQLSLSNKQAQYLKAIRRFYPRHKTLDIKALQHIYYHMQKHFDPTISTQAMQDIVILNQHLLIEKFHHWQQIYVPPFPIRGQDLIERGYPAGKELGDKLKQLERVYINSDFTIDKKDLLKLL